MYVHVYICIYYFDTHTHIILVSVSHHHCLTGRRCSPLSLEPQLLTCPVGEHWGYLVRHRWKMHEHEIWEKPPDIPGPFCFSGRGAKNLRWYTFDDPWCSRKFSEVIRISILLWQTMQAKVGPLGTSRKMRKALLLGSGALTRLTGALLLEFTSKFHGVFEAVPSQTQVASCWKVLQRNQFSRLCNPWESSYAEPWKLWGNPLGKVLWM